MKMIVGLFFLSISSRLGAALYGHQQTYYEQYPRPSAYQNGAYHEGAYQQQGAYQQHDTLGYQGNQIYGSDSLYDYTLGDYGDQLYHSPTDAGQVGYANDPNSLKSSRYGHHNSGYGGGYGHTKYVPVVHKPKKKKQKIISIDKGLFIRGGSQTIGKFKSLKSCMKACASSATCFAGDYNPWLGKCYFHTNTTACNTMSAHSKITHFKKVPCTAPGSGNTRIHLGAQLSGGIEQKGIDSLAKCLKKCANAGGGVAAMATELDDLDGGGQICFGIDYDFSSHKCYFHTVRIRRPAATAAVREATALCRNVANTPARTPVDLRPNGNVINVIICPDA